MEIEKRTENKAELFEEDDGRTIANMDGIDSRGIGARWFGALDPNVRAEHGPGRSAAPERPERPVEKWRINAEALDPEDRRALIKYVIGYSLAIGAVFAVIFGIVIFLMWRFW